VKLPNGWRKCRACAGLGRIKNRRRYHPEFQACRMLNHPEMWSAWTGEDDPRRRPIIEAMRSDALYAPTTYWKDVRITPLVMLARASKKAAEK
jgi:hypothetical protein